MAIAMTLAVFDINRAVDATGKPINVEFEFAAGTLTYVCILNQFNTKTQMDPFSPALLF